jgi:hypothetical protein
MDSAKFWWTFGIALFALVFSYVFTVVVIPGDWWYWFHWIWVRVLLVSLGGIFAFNIAWEWDVPFLSGRCIPFYVALAVSLLLTGIHQGIIYLLK